MFGFYTIASAAPRMHLGDIKANAKEIIALSLEAQKSEAGIILFPELSLLGYTIGDLISHSPLLSSQDEAIKTIQEHTQDSNIVIVIGVALKSQSRLYNCALVMQSGKLLGAVPKSFLPSKGEFYEHRYFQSGKDITNSTITVNGETIPFGVDLLFDEAQGLSVGIEICEDLWATTPPSHRAAEAGANLILNLSASNHLVGKRNYRQELVKSQSARLMAAYAYSSSSLGESGSTTIFSGDLMIAEYGTMLSSSQELSFESKIIYGQIDIQRIENLRLKEGSYTQSDAQPYRAIKLLALKAPQELRRSYTPYPFVPKEVEPLNEIIEIQSYGLLRRLEATGLKRVVIGISGGLDSTLALLSIHHAFRIQNRSLDDIIAITMPGFGTSDATFDAAHRLCDALDVKLRTIDIKPLCQQELLELNHHEQDLVYENVQARRRTALLMNIANKEHGLVIGTGDLSEIALGWNTYNGDHMSMYSINSAIPKTLVGHLVAHYGRLNSHLKELLESILELPISPELLPTNGQGEIAQKTESIVGPYELHDFFLYHFIKEGFGAKKLLYLAQNSFKDYDKEEIKKWLILFIRRFFSQQFKRNAMPDGVMVGSIDLNPRGSWRMPSDMSAQSYLEEIL